MFSDKIHPHSTEHHIKLKKEKDDSNNPHDELKEISDGIAEFASGETSLLKAEEKKKRIIEAQRKARMAKERLQQYLERIGNFQNSKEVRRNINSAIDSCDHCIGIGTPDNHLHYENHFDTAHQAMIGHMSEAHHHVHNAVNILQQEEWSRRHGIHSQPPEYR